MNKYKTEITIVHNGRAQFTTAIIEAIDEDKAKIMVEKEIEAIIKITNCNAIFYSPVEMMRDEE